MTVNKTLHDAVKEILDDWDPINIVSFGEVGNEYDSYINGVISLLKGGADKYKIEKHLERLEVVSMGLSEKSPRTSATARKLADLIQKTSK